MLVSRALWLCAMSLCSLRDISEVLSRELIHRHHHWEHSPHTHWLLSLALHALRLHLKLHQKQLLLILLDGLLLEVDYLLRL